MEDRSRPDLHHWGPADEVDSHPTGGTYDRPMNEGGGSTSTYPWEMLALPLFGRTRNNIEIEFVDPSGSGNINMTMIPLKRMRCCTFPERV